MNFKVFMDEVDRIMKAKYGIDSGSVEDWLWYDAYDEGLTPAEAFADWKERYDPGM